MFRVAVYFPDIRELDQFTSGSLNRRSNFSYHHNQITRLWPTGNSQTTTGYYKGLYGVMIGYNQTRISGV